MEFNSQICTTKTQSERLLALGLKKETADMNHYQYVYGGRWNVAAQPSIAGYNNRIVPAWSLHRLIKIANLPEYWECTSGDWSEEVIAYIHSEIHINEFNKEYLEVK
jgi:hypothetical protein